MPVTATSYKKDNSMRRGSAKTAIKLDGALCEPLASSQEGVIRKLEALLEILLERALEESDLNVAIEFFVAARVLKTIIETMRKTTPQRSERDFLVNHAY